ncbi:MAG: 30S ribosomal protein S17 [Deltaproteobacteria bacterium]|jgi:small subunit ribosomal protein S17|uniref:Small ribosomal subunit protein uS17 n=1 Tax=uncultured delta proteobacterium Rifle_16ft_4_minimus_809 TaxID=1665185 RepID=A0A0H4TVB8_9DELT|nr:30S ribosomal protein S17, small subunit ribosomal protein S17 [uncultured delta proteobacterium Rifle_16ft_4_minimus_809]OGP12269.1 MAG: 30S ribosomal protein S17 [Deltaproteobacteria bacterium GWA2_47_9]
MTERGIRKTLQGVVVSDKMDKTVVVKVDRTVRHPVYLKTIKKSAKYKAHDEGNTCHLGDKVVIEESRPLSRDKRWKVKGKVGQSA